MNAIHYDPTTGQVFSVIQFGTSSIALPLPPPGLEGSFVSSSVAIPAYFDGTTCTPIGESPSVNHEFNWVTKQWEDPRTLQDLKDEKWQAIKASRDAAEAGTFLWNGHTVDADKERINGAATGVLIAKGLGQVYSDVWTLADNSTIPVTGDDILSMGVSLVQHVSACHAHGRALRQQIEDAASTQEVDAVTWNL